MTTALLVIDMQNFFREMCTPSIPNILKLIDHCHTKGVPVVFTQHGHSKDELTPPEYGGSQLVKKWGPEESIAKGSENWKFIPEIANLQLPPGSDKSCVVGKNTYDAFINTDLCDILGNEGVTRVVVCGVMTDCCCDTTARSAFNRGYETWLVQDACSSANQTQHKAGLRGFAFAFGEVLDTNEVTERL